MGDARSPRRDELETLSNALACILQEENPLPPHEHEARESELSRRLSSRSSHGSNSPGRALHPQDVSIISRLLNQVHQLAADEDGGDTWAQTEDKKEVAIDPQAEMQSTNMVKAVVEIAGAAAEAARVAAASSGKNLEVMETLLADHNSNARGRRAPSEGQNEGARDTEAREDESPRPLTAAEKDIVKRLERQNRITHWVLGFMVVATAIWRWKLLTTFLGMRRTFSNPFQALGDMVSEGLKGGNADEPGEAKGFKKARTVLPSILGGEEKEIVKKTEKTEHGTVEDFKIGEALTVSLGNLFPPENAEGNEGNVGSHGSKGAKEEAPSKE